MIEEITIRFSNKIAKRKGFTKEQVILLALFHYAQDYLDDASLKQELSSIEEYLSHLIPTAELNDEYSLRVKAKSVLTRLFMQVNHESNDCKQATRSFLELLVGLLE